MVPRRGRALAQGPGWWYESWGLADWLATLFDQPLEVHAFLLGAGVGVLLAAVSARRRPREATLFTLVVLLFTFGAFETVLACSESFSACQHVRLKPWYFVAGFLGSHVAAMGIAGSAAPERPDEAAGSATAEGTVAGLVVAGLVVAALYSFVSRDPVHPITGLATLGGLVGAALGVAAFAWAGPGEPRRPRFVPTLRRVLALDVDGAALAIAYGTVLGFGYPRVFWELGRLAGSDGFLLGPLVWVTTGLPAVAAYASAILAGGLVVAANRRRADDQRPLDGRLVAALVLAVAVYAACLLLATGLAGTVWYRVIPSAPA